MLTNLATTGAPPDKSPDPDDHSPCCYWTVQMPLESWLVGGIPTPLKNMKGSWGYYSQLNGKIKFMFQTTNQTSCICLGGIRSKQHLQIVIPSPDIFHSLYIDSTWSQIWVCVTYGFQGGVNITSYEGEGITMFSWIDQRGGGKTSPNPAVIRRISAE